LATHRLARARFSVRWPVLVLLGLCIAAGYAGGALITSVAGAGIRRLVIAVAVVGLAAAAAAGLAALRRTAPRARELPIVAGAAVRRFRDRRARHGPRSGVLPVVAAGRPGTVSSPPAPPAVVPVQALRAELGERISLGARSRRLTPESVLPDDALRAWTQEQSADREYDLVRIVCAFRPQAGERFLHARLAVRLTGPPGRPTPVVMSMLPRSEQAVANRRRVVRLGANLRLLEAGTETESSNPVTVPQLTALGTLQSTAEWHLHTPALLFGEREFLLVLERATGSQVTCTFDIHVRIEWGPGDAGDYSAQLPPDVRHLTIPTSRVT
jgi:hypothetical protein